ncbi:efflux transporter outer membrane subunit [Massilia niastensis]|uniref:efflux transporter outer membrane subunit n=1 Tax=Massilia niastensis TaxID=544911 RepID=UPI000477CD4C|nr:efflux transporter outer membrane subunit [Massilia niastensis]
MDVRSFSLAALAALALGACSTTVGPDYRVPDAAVAKRGEAAAPFVGATGKPYSAAPLPAQWWRLYHDSTLDALVDRAFAANADLRVAGANLARARALLSEAEQLRRPEVDLSASPALGHASGAANGASHALPDRASYDAGLHVSYQLDLFGQIRRAVEAANADSESAQAAVDLARVTVAADTARAYAEACAAGQQIAIARQSVGLQGRFVASTAQRVKLGRGTALDNSRALGQLEQLRAALPPLEAQRRTALYRLAVLTGEAPARFPQAVARCATVPQLGSTIPVGDGAALLRRRPDIRQAERTLAGATARIGVATAELYPQVSLGLSAGSAGALSSFGKGDSLRYSLGPLISWTLPSTGAARAHIAQAEASAAAALARFDGVVLNALRETETALTAYARELDRHAALKAARDQSALASQQAAKLYRFGRTDFLTTLDAERTLASAQAAVAASEAKLATDQVTLFLALGGGWESPAR